ncbi:MAG: MFS transporter [Edaphobacter sp.]|uniref:MFS transporter n=1 Tax=Edaphobacter sp. TaxID=1934404 RepID=UPI002399B070|nr:MFS transporter [Edaphobacter sp.]MDE1177456.1 MFS transporter [Edaphobacter sp.]
MKIRVMSQTLQWQSRIFAVTWVAYASFYLCRKNFSVVIPLLSGHSTLGMLAFANMIFVYSLMYSAGQMICGVLSDRFGARLVVALSMCIAALANMAMAFTSSPKILFAMMMVNGLGQAGGWPGLVQMMSNWFPKKNRGIVMSWWTTNYVLGAFLATLAVTYFATRCTFLPGAAWQRAFWMPAVILLCVAAFYFLGVRDTPEEVGVQIVELEETSMPDPNDPALSQILPSQSMFEKFLLIARSPEVLVIAGGCLFAKITRYAFLFWLPLYMTQQLHYRAAEASYTSGIFELAGFAGALAAGYLSDKCFGSRRFPVCALMFWGLGIACLLQPFLGAASHWTNALGIALIGITNFGPDTLLQGAASQDAGGALSTGTVSGFISGVGSLGQLISPYMVALMAGRFGWNLLFHVFVIFALCGGLLQAFYWNYGRLPEEEPREMTA